MSYEERVAFVQLAQYFPILLLVVVFFTRRFPLLVSSVLLMIGAIIVDHLTVPDRPNLALIHGEITSFWSAVTLVLAFLWRAQQSNAALMRAIAAPFVLAEYFILELPTIITLYYKHTFFYREGWGWYNGWIVWPLSQTLERLLTFIDFALNKLYFFGHVTKYFPFTILAPVVFGLVFIPIGGLLLYIAVVWWYTPYLSEYPDVEIPEHLPPGFISQMKAARIRALRTMFQEHTAFVDFLRYFARKRAARNYTH